MHFAFNSTLSRDGSTGIKSAGTAILARVEIRAVSGSANELMQ